MIFFRFIEKPEHAQYDLGRGWSVVAQDDDPEYLEDLNEDGGYELVETPDYFPCRYALKIDGLCGYGPFDTIEEAREAAREEKENAGSDEPWKEHCRHVAYFTGEDAGSDMMAGDLFVPTGMIDVD